MLLGGRRRGAKLRLATWVDAALMMMIVTEACRQPFTHQPGGLVPLPVLLELQAGLDHICNNTWRS